MALSMGRSGYHVEAVAALVSFECYLRVGELLRLRYCDLAVRNDPDLGSAYTGMALRLQHTKTGRNQWVSVRAPVVADALQDYLEGRDWSADDLVFPFSRCHWSRLLKRCAAVLGVSHIGVVPHSFRHGGATCDHLRGVPVDDIRRHGRWKSLESATRYIQTGPALLLYNHVPRAVTLRAQQLVHCLPACLAFLRELVSTRTPVPRARVCFH
jgi:integrase